MKRLIILLLIPILLQGCLKRRYLPVSKENMSKDGKCMFSSIDGLVYKLGNPVDIRLDAQKTLKTDYFSLIEEHLSVILRGKKIKIVKFESSKPTFRITSELKSFGANGKQHIYNNDGMFVAVTEECEIIFLKPSGVFGDRSNLLTKIDASPIDENDKFEIAKRYNRQMLNEFEVKKKGDKFDKEIWISTPTVDDTFLRAFVDESTDKIVFIQIYAMTSALDWKYLSRAKDQEQNEFKVSKIDTDVDCSRFGCRHFETVGIDISYSYLESHHNGIEIKVSGKGGDTIVRVPAKSVDLLVKALKKYSKV